MKIAPPRVADLGAQDVELALGLDEAHPLIRVLARDHDPEPAPERHHVVIEQIVRGARERPRGVEAHEGVALGEDLALRHLRLRHADGRLLAQPAVARADEELGRALVPIAAWAIAPREPPHHGQPRSPRDAAPLTGRLGGATEDARAVVDDLDRAGPRRQGDCRGGIALCGGGGRGRSERRHERSRGGQRREHARGSVGMDHDGIIAKRKLGGQKPGASRLGQVIPVPRLEVAIVAGDRGPTRPRRRARLERPGAPRAPRPNDARAPTWGTPYVRNRVQTG